MKEKINITDYANLITKALPKGILLNSEIDFRRLLQKSADEKVLDENGRIDGGKIDAFLFDQVRFDYYSVGGICGRAWHSGAPLVKGE